MMTIQVFTLAYVLLTCFVGGRQFFHDHMQDAFDDISFYSDGEGHPFNATFYHELVQCFHKFNDTSLYKSQIAGWKGIADYWRSNSTNMDYMGRTDFWGQSSPGLHGDKQPYDEFYYRPNVTIGRYNILTYEPCNYASNLAYYHSVLKICKYDWAVDAETQHNLIQALATFAIGSAFMHQSYTYVGIRYDNLMIGVLAYLGQQTIVQNLPHKTSMLQELQQERRSINATQLISTMTETIRSKPVPTWAQVMDHGDFPQDYFLTFAAIVCDITSLILPGFITTPVIDFFAGLILPHQKYWITKEYLPEIISATKNNKIPILKRVDLLIKFWGVLFKLLFAFLYQERMLPVPGFRTHPIIWIGGFLIPLVNTITNGLTGFRQSDDNVNQSQFLYPGQKVCKHDQGHAIWHEVSANGLLDLIYLCDHMNSLVIQYIH